MKKKDNGNIIIFTIFINKSWDYKYIINNLMRSVLKELLRNSARSSKNLVRGRQRAALVGR